MAIRRGVVITDNVVKNKVEEDKRKQRIGVVISDNVRKNTPVQNTPTQNTGSPIADNLANNRDQMTAGQIATREKALIKMQERRDQIARGNANQARLDAKTAEAIRKRELENQAIRSGQANAGVVNTASQSQGGTAVKTPNGLVDTSVLLKGNTIEEQLINNQYTQSRSLIEQRLQQARDKSQAEKDRIERQRIERRNNISDVYGNRLATAMVQGHSDKWRAGILGNELEAINEMNVELDEVIDRGELSLKDFELSLMGQQQEVDANYMKNALNFIQTKKEEARAESALALKQYETQAKLKLQQLEEDRAERELALKNFEVQSKVQRENFKAEQGVNIDRARELREQIKMQNQVEQFNMTQKRIANENLDDFLWKIFDKSGGNSAGYALIQHLGEQGIVIDNPDALINARQTEDIRDAIIKDAKLYKAFKDMSPEEQNLFLKDMPENDLKIKLSAINRMAIDNAGVSGNFKATIEDLFSREQIITPKRLSSLYSNNKELVNDYEKAWNSKLELFSNIVNQDISNRASGVPTVSSSFSSGKNRELLEQYNKMQDALQKESAMAFDKDKSSGGIDLNKFIKQEAVTTGAGYKPQ